MLVSCWKLRGLSVSGEVGLIDGCQSFPLQSSQSRWHEEAVADLGEGTRGRPLFWVKKEKEKSQTEEKLAGASKKPSFS